jgi:hypothetical protein
MSDLLTLEARLRECPEIGTTYQHSSGRALVVLGHAVDEPTLLPLVLVSDGGPILWAGPADDWEGVAWKSLSVEEISAAELHLRGCPSAGDYYRHYKGELVQVVGRAVHHNSLEALVLYREASGTIWARRLAVWSETVDLQGRKVPRFQFVQR